MGCGSRGCCPPSPAWCPPGHVTVIVVICHGHRHLGLPVVTLDLFPGTLPPVLEFIYVSRVLALGVPQHAPQVFPSPSPRGTVRGTPPLLLDRKRHPPGRADLVPDVGTGLRWPLRCCPDLCNKQLDGVASYHAAVCPRVAPLYAGICVFSSSW